MKTLAVCPVKWVNYLAVSSDSKMLYATRRYYRGEDGEGGVAAFEVSDEHICPAAEISSGGLIPCYLAIDTSGRWLYWTNYMSGSFGQCCIHAGRKMRKVDIFRHTGHGSHFRQREPHPHHVCFAPHESRLYVTDLGANQIVGYPFSPLEGIRTDQISYFAMPDGCGPRHLLFGRFGKKAYVVNEIQCSVSEIECLPEGWRLLQTVEITPEVVRYNSERAGSAAIKQSTDGRHILTTDRGYDAVAHFTLQNGRLLLSEKVSSGGRWPMDLCFDDKSHFVLCANQDSDEICAFHLDNNGRLIDTGRRYPIDSPVCVIPATI